MATSTRLFKGRVVEDSDEKKGIITSINSVVVLSSILGRTPNIDEYKAAVRNIDLTKFAPPNKEDKQEIPINF
ncbi:MAG: hypothetical protein CM15mP58_14170 [Burkholderiaceae bacterium]|nr:MAG: hypothetical protein CM15mP58_14170 [Burkholderiaceae bacterium]